MPLRLPVRRRHKFNAEGVRHSGIYFPSKKECRRFMELEMLERAGVIRNLRPHPPFELWVLAPNGECVTVGKFTADSEYEIEIDGQWHRVVEDVKGGEATKTAAYKLRKQMFETIYGLTVSEV